MIAYGVRKYGKDSKLERFEIPDPRPDSGEVLIRIRAASVNPVDFKVRNGELRLVARLRKPILLGSDCAGVIEAVGPGVTRFKVGDEVFTRPEKERIGTFAQRICVREESVALKPENTSFAEAASLPLVALTAWQAFVEHAKLKPGQKVFIPAGAGGVGTVAIQLAKHLGATVATTASLKKLDLVKSLGADFPIDYHREDFRERVKDYDMVLDTLGGEDQRRAFECLRPGGMLVSIVGPPTRQFAEEWKLPIWVRWGAGLLGRGTERRAARLNTQYRFLLMHSDGNALGEIAKLVEIGVIRPVVDRIYPLEQVEEALRYVETGHAMGKVVIRI